MRPIEERLARLIRFGFTRQQARVLAVAGFDVFFIPSAAVGL